MLVIFIVTWLYSAVLRTNRFSTSIIMSIVYDYATLPRDDPFIALVEQSLEISVRELRPEVAAIVGEFPIRTPLFSPPFLICDSICSQPTVEKLPPWFPGASFVRGAILQRSLVPRIVDIPFEHVKKNMASEVSYSRKYTETILRPLVRRRHPWFLMHCIA